MALTEEQRIARRNYLGSSEAAAVLGVDPHASAADVWLQKTNRAAPFAGNDATRRGQRLEPAILDYADEELGRPCVRDQMVLHASGLLCTNFDGLLVGEDGVLLHAAESVEAKSSVLNETWGEPGTDQVPPRVIAQVHHGFACLPSLTHCHVAVLTPGYRSFDFKLYRVDRDPEIVAAVERAGVEFMEVYVRGDVPPTAFRPAMDVLRRIRREPGKLVPVAAGAIRAWMGWRAARLACEKREEAAAAAMVALMGDAEAAEADDGSIVGRVTYMTTRRKAYAVKATEYRKLAAVQLNDTLDPTALNVGDAAIVGAASTLLQIESQPNPKEGGAA